jgi:hypothetical protein
VGSDVRFPAVVSSFRPFGGFGVPSCTVSWESPQSIIEPATGVNRKTYTKLTSEAHTALEMDIKVGSLHTITHGV